MFQAVSVYGYMGWTEINHNWLYLHTGGALGADGNQADVAVDLGQSHMENYRLPDPPIGDDLITAIQASLDVLKISSNPVHGFLSLASIYRAPLAECHPIDYAVFFEGKTGSQKSEITAIQLAHFGDRFSSRSFPASWEDTITSLEIKGHRTKDALIVIDDFKPKGSGGEISALHSKADKVFRGVGNQSGRGRCNSKLETRKSYHPRGMVIASGEDIPYGQSLRARTAITEVVPGDVNLDELTKLQLSGASGALARTMSGYIQWLAPQIAYLKESIPNEILNYRESGIRFSHDRGLDIFANLNIGLCMFLRYAVWAGAISADESERIAEEARQEFHDLMTAQSDYQVDSDEVSMFVGLLVSALSSGRCHLADIKTGREPVSNPSFLGWERNFEIR